MTQCVFRAVVYAQQHRLAGRPLLQVFEAGVGGLGFVHVSAALLCDGIHDQSAAERR